MFQMFLQRTAINTGPITRARARQLNYQVLSFLGNDSNVHENMMLHKLDTFVLLTNEGIGRCFMAKGPKVSHPEYVDFNSSRFVAIVRIRSSTVGSALSVRLLHGLVSSSLRDLRQDDLHLGSHYYHCYASCFVLSLCFATYLLLFKPPKLPCQPLTFCTIPSKPLLGYVTAFAQPLL